MKFGRTPWLRGILLAALICMWASSPAWTTQNPVPLTIVVLGDSLADGLYAGIYRTVHGDQNLSVMRMSKVGGGLTRHTMIEWEETVTKILEVSTPKIAVVMTGGNDLMPLTGPDNRRYAFKSPEWERLYIEKVCQHMNDLRNNNITTYWVEMPVMREESYDREIQYLNKIQADCATQTGVHYVRVRELTVDEHGGYTAYGKDLLGRMTLLRANDGKHFTAAGYELLANRVLEKIQADLGTFKMVSRRE